MAAEVLKIGPPETMRDKNLTRDRMCEACVLAILGRETTRSTVPLASVVTIQYFITPTGEACRARRESREETSS